MIVMAFAFWGSKKARAAEPVSAPSETPSAASAYTDPCESLLSADDGDAAAETLAAVLRGLGNHAFGLDAADLPSIRRTFERLAEHVLVAAPIEPIGEERRGDEVEKLGQRQWRAVRESAVSHRRREAAFVVKTLAALREVIWSFVAIVNRAAAADRQHGLVAGERLSRLRTALQSNDPDVLRREATATASLFEQALEEQGRRQTQQLADFAAHVRNLGEQLEGARRDGATDALTQLFNRACFDDFLERTVDLAALFNRPAALVMVDVDNFKAVNDGFGHPGGDALLRAISDCLARTFPRRTDLVARYGGDEFAVVLKDVRPADVPLLGQRLIEATRAIRIQHGGREIRTTVSLGSACFECGDTAATWLARADAALYAAKAAGRDRLVNAPPSPRTP